ncbi:thermonuclease family protein [candidate division KSB1 bacterium]|nr:thermonuclease family protein [candidate division KSB1 bacterium]
MNILDNESVHLIITSPPYWQLKDYDTAEQIGFHENYESYINNLNLVWSECHRVLHPGCRLCVNIGDQFARSVYYGRYKVIPIRTEIIKFCEIIGFDYMGAIIWQKVTTTNTSGGATIMGSFPYPRNGILKLDYEFILLFKKPGKATIPNPELKRQSAMSKDEWNSYFSGHWVFAGAKQKGHLAMFPEELPARLIKMFAFVSDTVLDPFLGSGTTSLAARNLNRNSVGYEINEAYLPVIKDKLNWSQIDLENTEYQLLEDKLTFDPVQRIETLPYIFNDPHALNNQIEIKQRQFGSKIDKHSSDDTKYFSIKEIIDPLTLRLNDNRTIRLLGVCIKDGKTDEATRFIESMIKRQKVFLRFDDNYPEESDNLKVYLYLKNKTFINAHLIKKGFARTDSSCDFKHKKKFMKYEDTASD